MRQAATVLGDWRIDFVGLSIDGAVLAAIADHDPEAPFTRVVREQLRRPIDVDDFLLFLDDVLRRGAAGWRGKTVFITSGRARKAGILVHPDDVFFEKPRRYGGGPIAIHPPQTPKQVSPAHDGDLLGPDWTARYQNPDTTESMLNALRKESPTSDFASRLQSLSEQVKAQGGESALNSTVRNRHRGYLMWGAYLLSNAKSQAEVESALETLEDRNQEWKLDIDIRWRHPEGWQATVAAAKAMAETYDVVYATEQGARSSNHYGARAADLTSFALPRRFTLEAPDGVKRTFDLSNPDNTRDISLEPEIIGWIERHFGMKKLLDDYPHWNDVAD